MQEIVRYQNPWYVWFVSGLVVGIWLTALYVVMFVP